VVLAYRETEPKQKIVIVTGDGDLYQLLSKRVSVYHPQPKKIVTAASFMESYGISPPEWAKVKAVAGCKGDDVPGIDGVGEKTAAAFYSRIPTRVTPRIMDMIYDWETTREFKRNLRLVKLPLKGCPAFTLRKDRYDLNGWNDLMTEIGAQSLLKQTTPWGGSEVVF
jgi:5'-3' exonuclease